MSATEASSRMLSGYLDYIELSPDHVASRVSLFSSLEALAAAVDFQSEYHPTIITGSTMDGVFWKNYISDLDTMILVPHVVVSDDIESIKKGSNLIFEIDEEDVHPGYIRLKYHADEVISPDSIFTITNGGAKSFCTVLNDEFYFSAYKFKRAYNRYQLIHEKPAWVFQSSYNYAAEWPDEEEVLEHGPAVAFAESHEDDNKSDVVPCLPCPLWPKQASEWIHRKRGEWPLQSQIQAIVSKGCKVVPVAFRGSSAKEIEWRFSFSLPERDLVRSFNNTQHKVYALMKMIFKEAVSKEIPDILSSFHMKNAVLWTVEQADPSTWCEEKIATAFLECLKVVHNWLKCGQCPHYFIASNNIFDGKVEGENLKKLEDLFGQYVSEGWMCLRRCSSMNDYFKKYDKEGDLEFKPTPGGAIWFGHDMKLFSRYEHARVELMTYLDTCDDVAIAVVNHHKIMHQIENRTPDDHYRKILEPLANSISSSLGYHLYTIATLYPTEDDHYKQFIDAAEKYLWKGQKSDATAGKLKLATFYYQNSEYEKCLEIVKGILTNENLLPLYMPAFLPKLSEPLEEHVTKFESFVEKTQMSTEERFLNSAAHPVIFFPSEMHAVPDAIKFQLQKPQSDPLDYVRWLRWAVYDPQMFAYYLRFLCYQETDLPRALQALSAIEDMLQRGVLGYQTSALNLLGYSYVLIQNMEKGVKYLLQAMEEDIFPQTTIWQLAGSLGLAKKTVPSKFKSVI